MDRLADGLQKLGEDDLLQVVQMVHDNKAADSYTKNDVERKCFFRNQLEEPPHLTHTDISSSWRIPRGLVHSTRRTDQNALGLYGRAWCSLRETQVCGRANRREMIYQFSLCSNLLPFVSVTSTLSYFVLMIYLSLTRGVSGPSKEIGWLLFFFFSLASFFVSVSCCSATPSATKSSW